jgi:UDP-galactopyranose mutase
MKRVLVVGCGFSGATIARELADNGYMVEIIDKRNHIGGNAYDYTDEHGIRIHQYGPHIFHTNNEKVFHWLSRFTEWVPYKHKVKAMLSDGRLVTLPINRETKEIVGEENLIDTFIRPYSEKMWAMPLEKLDPAVLNRVPMREDDNEYYFPNDEFQYMPVDGFTKMFERILDHPSISICTNRVFEKQMEENFDHIFCSMPIDEYYEYKHGKLPYRSIKFHRVSLPLPRLFPVSVVNFTHEGPFTRVVEWKNFPNHGENEEFTIVTYEEPCDYLDNDMERFYPVKDISGTNQDIYSQYQLIENQKVTFIGRLGLYQYLDMHQCVNISLVTARKFINEDKKN